VAVSLMMRGFGYPQGTGFDAGVRFLETSVVCSAAHSPSARAGTMARRRSLSLTAMGRRSSHGAVTAAQRKPASSRASATVATLAGLPRERKRWCVRYRRC
jgi:hypothetical protein